MRIAEYRIGRKAPLEWRGLLDRYVRDVANGFWLSNAITSASLPCVLGDSIRYRPYIFCCQVYIDLSFACLDSNPCSSPIDCSSPSALCLCLRHEFRDTDAHQTQASTQAPHRYQRCDMQAHNARSELGFIVAFVERTDSATVLASSVSVCQTEGVCPRNSIQAACGQSRGSSRSRARILSFRRLA